MFGLLGAPILLLALRECALFTELPDRAARPKRRAEWGVARPDTLPQQAGLKPGNQTVNGTTFVVCGFHQGRKLKPQHFSCEAQARERALVMAGSLDGVVLTTSTAQATTQRAGLPRGGSNATWSAEALIDA